MSDLISQDLNMIFKTPKGETVHALKDVNFTLKKGELLTVLGPSGCGKTTLLNITAGFLRPTSGKITLNEKEIDGPGVERGMVRYSWFKRIWEHSYLPIIRWYAAESGACKVFNK